ncbi:MAG: hypothetical protein CM15mP103_02510 [Gammaproteobacteria bacterium]|nr:MAG: hypothetical protein CM15mP103_02510 [Gammaproteobacteria bacterium]
MILVSVLAALCPTAERDTEGVGGDALHPVERSWIISAVDKQRCCQLVSRRDSQITPGENLLHVLVSGTGEPAQLFLNLQPSVNRVSKTG